MEIQFTFITISLAIIKLFILMLAGYMLYRLRLINESFVDMLSQILVRVIFPALIISKIISYFSFVEYPQWWILPLCAVVFSVVGMAMGALVFRLIRGSGSEKEFICSSGFQNCGYLPMNIIVFAFSGAVADRLLVYLFFFILGFNVLMWSLVPLFLTGKLRSGFRPDILLNSPVVATIFAVLWVAVAGKGSMPAVIMDPLRQLGQAAFPIAMLTLGAYLCRYRGYNLERKLPLISALSLKLLIFPAVVLAVLILLPVGEEYKFFLFLQAIMPTAVSLVVIGSYTGADNGFFTNIIFYTHVVSIFSIPLWLGVFHMLVNR